MTGVYANSRSCRKSLRDLAGRARSGRPAPVPARGLAHVGMARRADRLLCHLPSRPVGLADAPRRRASRLSLRFGDRRLERRLDHLLGSDAVQHAGHDRRLRQAAPLAHPARDARRAGADHPVRLGLRRPARRAGRLRLPLGLRRADPDHARHSGARCHPGRGHRQQRAGVLWRARSADHRARGGDRHAAPGARRLGRQDRRDPRPPAPVDPALPRERKRGRQGRLAARHRRFARLHRGSAADLDLSRPLSAGRHRRDRVLRLPSRPPQGVAAGAHARLRRRADDRGAGITDRKPWAHFGRSLSRMAPDHRSRRHRRRLDGALVVPAGSQLAPPRGFGRLLDHAGCRRSPRRSTSSRSSADRRFLLPGSSWRS